MPVANVKTGPVQIKVLGPFEVRTDDGVLVDVPGARLRALLVALALEPGRIVPKTTTHARHLSAGGGPPDTAALRSDNQFAPRAAHRRHA